MGHQLPQPSAGWRVATVTDRATGRGPVRLRPLTVGELLDDPFELLRANARTLILLVAALVVPFELVVGFLQRTLLGGVGLVELLSDPTAAQIAFEQPGVRTVEATALQALVGVTAYGVVEGLIARVGVSSLLGERLTPGEALRATVRRWPALLAGWFLVMAATFGPGLIAIAFIAVDFGGTALAAVGVLLFFVAAPVGLLAYTVLRAVPTIIVVEGLGPLAALRRSATLLRPRLFVALAAILLALLVGSLVQTALAALPTAGGFLFGLEAGWLLVSAGAIAAGLVVRPFQALVGALLYVDARVRREGFDLEVRSDTGVPVAR